MTIAEIENLSFADLKARRDELIQAAFESEDRGQLASRYVQARTDAKLRDEKLAEQGKTIDALTVGNAALQERFGSAEAYAQTLEEQLQEAREETRRGVDALKSSQSLAASEKHRADAAEKLAKARRVALAEVMKVISPVLAEE